LGRQFSVKSVCKPNRTEPPTAIPRTAGHGFII
jgi:hypothetical protein